MSEETCDQYHDVSPGQFYLSPPSPASTLRNEAVFFYGPWHGPGPGDPVFDPGAYECSGMVSAHGRPLVCLYSCNLDSLPHFIDTTLILSMPVFKHIAYWVNSRN